MKKKKKNTSNTWKSYHVRHQTPHIRTLFPPTSWLLYNIQHRRTLAGQPYPLPSSVRTFDALHSNEHYSTYYGAQHALTTTNSFARTSIQRSPTAISLLPLIATLFWSKAPAHATHSYKDTVNPALRTLVVRKLPALRTTFFPDRGGRQTV